MNTQKQIEGIWTDWHKIGVWVRIELEWLRALERLGVAPRDSHAVATMRIGEAHYHRGELIPAVVEREQEIHHDVAAFVDVLHRVSGCQFIHWGLTSSDIIDTAYGFRFMETALVLFGLTGKIMHKNDFRAELLAHAFASASVGKLSGPVGNYSHGISPDVERDVLSTFGLTPETVATQVVARDRYAYLVCACALVHNSVKRKTDPEMQAYVTAIMESVALWHERDISHSCIDRIAWPRVFGLLARAMEERLNEKVKADERP